MADPGLGGAPLLRFPWRIQGWDGFRSHVQGRVEDDIGAGGGVAIPTTSENTWCGNGSLVLQCCANLVGEIAFHRGSGPGIPAAFMIRPPVSPSAPRAERAKAPTPRSSHILFQRLLRSTAFANQTYLASPKQTR